MLTLRLAQQAVEIVDVTTDMALQFGCPITAITAEPIVAKNMGYHGRLLLNFKEVVDCQAYQDFLKLSGDTTSSTIFRVVIDAELVHEGPRDGDIYDPVLHVRCLHSSERA